jgi:hypothetical protein
MTESDMAASKPQFDILLGGTQNLPLEFSVGRFAAARAQEIAALTEAIGKYNGVTEGMRVPMLDSAADGLMFERA